MPEGLNVLSADLVEQAALSKVYAQIEAAEQVAFTDGDVPDAVSTTQTTLGALKVRIAQRQAAITASQQSHATSSSASTPPEPYSAGVGAKFFFEMQDALRDMTTEVAQAPQAYAQQLAEPVRLMKEATAEGFTALTSTVHYTEAQIATMRAAERAELEAIKAEATKDGTELPGEGFDGIASEIQNRIDGITDEKPYVPAEAFAFFNSFATRFASVKPQAEAAAAALNDSDVSAEAQKTRAMKKDVDCLYGLSNDAPSKLITVLATEAPAEPAADPRVEETARLTALNTAITEAMNGPELSVGGDRMTNAGRTTAESTLKQFKEFILVQAQTDITARLAVLADNTKAYEAKEAEEVQNLLAQYLDNGSKITEGRRARFNAPTIASDIKGAMNIALDKIEAVTTKLRGLTTPTQAADPTPVEGAITQEQEQQGLNDLLDSIRNAKGKWRNPDETQRDYVMFLNSVGDKIQARLHAINAADHTHSAEEAADFKAAIRKDFADKGAEIDAARAAIDAMTVQEARPHAARYHSLGAVGVANNNLLPMVDAIGPQSAANNAPQSRFQAMRAAVRAATTNPAAVVGGALRDTKNGFRANWGMIAVTAGATFALKTMFVAAALAVTTPGLAVPVGAMAANVIVRLVRDELKHRKAKKSAIANGQPVPADRTWADRRKSVYAGAIIGIVGYGIGSALNYAAETWAPDAVASVRHFIHGGGSAPAAPAPALPEAGVPDVNPMNALKAEIQAHIDAGHFDGLTENGMSVKQEIIKALANGDELHLAARIGGAGYIDFNGADGTGGTNKILGARLYGLAQRYAEAVHLDGSVHPVRASLDKSVAWLSKSALFAPLLKP